MQKKLIALAIAGLSTAAFAQSSVEVYGKVDAFIGAASADGLKSLTKVDSGGLASSRLGFKGVEDLGNGLKALFVLEYGLASDVNAAPGTSETGGANARQQLLGLTGAFGTVAAGRLQTTGYDWGDAYDVLAATKISPLQNLTTSQGLIGATNNIGARASNAVAYISPNLNGVTLAVNYSAHTPSKLLGNNNAYEQLVGDNGESPNVKAFLASAKYDNGPASVGLVYAQGKQDGNTNLVAGSTLSVKVQDWALGGSYNFGVATLKATYQTTKATVDGTTGETDHTFSVGAAAPVSAAGTVVASYASTKLKSVADDANQAKSWTVAYLHALSKRTTAYAGYNRVTNDANVGFSIANDQYGAANANAVAGQQVANGATSSIAVVGLNHKF